MPTRINHTLAYKIARAVAEAAFLDDIEKLTEERKKMAGTLARTVLRHFKLDRAFARIDDKFKRPAYSIYLVADTYKNDVSCDLDEPILLFGVDKQLSLPLAVVEDWPETKRLRELFDRGKAMHDAAKATLEEVRECATRVRTVEKLIEAWPDAEHVLRQFLDPGASGGIPKPLSAVLQKHSPKALPAPAKSK